MEGEQWNWRFCALLSWRRTPRDTKASPSETDTKSAPLERICTICEERFCWSWELEERESRRGRLGAGRKGLGRIGDEGGIGGAGG